MNQPVISNQRDGIPVSTHLKVVLSLFNAVKIRIQVGESSPGKNPGENLCSDTVMTLEVKLNASSTPVNRISSMTNVLTRIYGSPLIYFMIIKTHTHTRSIY